MGLSETGCKGRRWMEMTQGIIIEIFFLLNNAEFLGQQKNSKLPKDGSQWPVCD
jgi:hypothetical protein